MQKKQQFSKILLKSTRPLNRLVDNNVVGYHERQLLLEIDYPGYILMLIEPASKHFVRCICDIEIKRKKR